MAIALRIVAPLTPWLLLFLCIRRAKWLLDEERECLERVGPSRTFPLTIWANVRTLPMRLEPMSDTG